MNSKQIQEKLVGAFRKVYTCAIPTLNASQWRLIVDEIDLYCAPIGIPRGVTVSAAEGILNRHEHIL